jgi:MFS family permease
VTKQAEGDHERFSMARLTRGFSYHDYRKYWTGSNISILAFRMPDVILGWQVLEMTDSAFMVGLVAFARGIPLLLLSPFSGILADNLQRQRVMALALALGALASGGLAVLMLVDMLAPWHIVLASLLVGSSFALYAPARLALLPRLVPEGVFISASTVEYSSTRVFGSLGPMVAGAVMDWKGAPLTLVVQLSLFVLGALVFLRTGLQAAQGGSAASRKIHLWSDLSQAGSYLSRDRALLSLLLLGLVVVPVGLAYQRVMPVFARDVFGAGPTMLGIMLGLGDIGVAMAGLGIAAVDDSFSRGKVLRLTAGLFGGGLVILAFTRSTLVALSLLLVQGIIVGVFLTLTNVIFQSRPPDRLRGRVMSAWGMVWGVLPLTSLAVGALAEKWPMNLIIAACGAVCAAFAAGMMLFGDRLHELRGQA